MSILFQNKQGGVNFVVKICALPAVASHHFVKPKTSQKTNPTQLPLKSPDIWTLGSTFLVAQGLQYILSSQKVGFFVPFNTL